MCNGATGVWKPIYFHNTCCYSFVPNKLPPRNPRLEVFNNQMTTLSEAIELAEKSISSLKEASRELKYPKAVAVSFMKKEALFSNRIEDNTMSLYDYLVSDTFTPEKEKQSPDPHELENISQTLNIMQAHICYTLSLLSLTPTT
jgi:Fic/DOC family N-terminal